MNANAIPAVAGGETVITLVSVIIILSPKPVTPDRGLVHFAGRSPGWRRDGLSPSRFPSGIITDPNRLQSRGRLWFWIPAWVTRTKFPFQFRMLCIQRTPYSSISVLTGPNRQERLRHPSAGYRHLELSVAVLRSFPELSK